MKIQSAAFILVLIIQIVSSQNAQPANPQQVAFVQPTIISPQNTIDPEAVPSRRQQQKNVPNQIIIQPKVDISINNQSQQDQLKRMKREAEEVAAAQQMKKAYLQRSRNSVQIDEEQQLKKLEADGQISKTQKKKQEERIKFKRQAKKVEPGTKFNQHLFQLSTSAQFLLKLPVTQQVALNLYTYISEYNTYVRTKSIQTQVPVKVFIYQDNQRVVFHGQFYYQIYITFQGKANSIYTIRTFNEGSLKLISMSIKKIIQQSHVKESFTDELAKFHSKRTQSLAIQIHKWFMQFRRLAVLDFQDMRQIQESVKKYYFYEIVQSFAGIILCIIQVKMIRKMLKGNTIV